MEEWLKINPYDYSVSNLGRMRNDRTGRILKKRIRRDGYVMATIYSGEASKPINVTVHRLVAMLFLRPPSIPEKTQVNHIDGNPLNNHFFNLEWVTPKENSQHAVRIGLFPRGETHHFAKISDSQIIEIRKLYATGKFAQYEIGKKFGVNQSEVSRYINKVRRGGHCG